MGNIFYLFDDQILGNGQFIVKMPCPLEGVMVSNTGDYDQQQYRKKMGLRETSEVAMYLLKGWGKKLLGETFLGQF